MAGNGDKTSNESEQKQPKRKRCYLYACIGVGGIVCILIVALVATIFIQRSNNNDAVNPTPNLNVTNPLIPFVGDPPPNDPDNNNNNDNDDNMMNSEIGKMIAEILPKNSLENIIVDFASPQHKAFAYLVNNEQNIFNNNFDMEEPLPASEQSKAITIFSLVTLYYSLDGPKWFTNKNWLNSEVNVCEWQGVNCQGELIRKAEDVEQEEEQQQQQLWGGINNQMRFLEGGLDYETESPEILLDEANDDVEGDDYTVYDDDVYYDIRSLKLNANNLSGNLPDELGLLTNIFELIDFGVNNIFGSIPSNLGMLSKLQGIVLKDNELSSTLPTELGQMTGLRKFDILRNSEIEGTFPSEFENWTKLGTYV